MSTCDNTINRAILSQHSTHSPPYVYLSTMDKIFNIGSNCKVRMYTTKYVLIRFYAVGVINMSPPSRQTWKGSMRSASGILYLPPLPESLIRKILQNNVTSIQKAGTGVWNCIQITDHLDGFLLFVEEICLGKYICIIYAFVDQTVLPRKMRSKSG